MEGPHAPRRLIRPCTSTHPHPPGCSAGLGRGARGGGVTEVPGVAGAPGPRLLTGSGCLRRPWVNAVPPRGPGRWRRPAWRLAAGGGSLAGSTAEPGARSESERCRRRRRRCRYCRGGCSSAFLRSRSPSPSCPAPSPAAPARRPPPRHSSPAPPSPGPARSYAPPLPSNPPLPLPPLWTRPCPSIPVPLLRRFICPLCGSHSPPICPPLRSILVPPFPSPATPGLSGGLSLSLLVVQKNRERERERGIIIRSWLKWLWRPGSSKICS